MLKEQLDGDYGFIDTLEQGESMKSVMVDGQINLEELAEKLEVKRG